VYGKRANILSGVFTDHRDPTWDTHPVSQLVRQRVYGVALGCEDLNDHDALPRDLLIAVLAESDDLHAAGACKCPPIGWT